MAEKNIQIKNLAGDLLFPKTRGAVVINNAGENLGAVEAGAQVNKIETVKVNGVALNIVEKAVDVVIPAAAEYSIAKAEVAENGASATYQLTKDGVAIGGKINIPKDMGVESGTVKECTEADAPVAGFKVGDKYIDLVLANTDDQHIYVLVSDLIDVYTAADETIVIENNTIKVNVAKLGDNFYTEEEIDAKLAQYAAAFTEEQMAAVNSGITAEKVGAYDAHVADADIHVTTEDKATWTAKQDALTEDQLKAVNSGITAEKVTAYDGLQAQIDAKVAQADYDAKIAELEAKDAELVAKDAELVAKDAEIEAEVAKKVAQADYDAKIAELEAADTALGQRIDALLLYEEIAE